MMKIMKDYIVSRDAWIDRTILTNESTIPRTPQATYVGQAGFPVNGLTFETSASKVRSVRTFSALEWRIAEITDPSAPSYDPFDHSAPRKYEIEATWESGPLEEFSPTITVPGHLVQPGRTYRVRVRMRDNDDHWSHWSEPVQFVAGPRRLDRSGRCPAGQRGELQPVRSDTLRNEPPAFTDNNEFEFIELVNISDRTIDLQGAELTQVQTDNGEEGVAFRFADGAIHSLHRGSACWSSRISRRSRRATATTCPSPANGRVG